MATAAWQELYNEMRLLMQCVETRSAWLQASA
jgi:hypothetical protein